MINKKLLITLGLFLVIYIILYMVFSAPAVERAIGNLLMGNTVSLIEGAYEDVRFAEFVEEKDERTSMRIGYANMNSSYIKRQQDLAKARGQKTFNVQMLNAEFYVGYFTMPFIFMLALIAVTPLQWKQRLIALLLSILLFYLFSLFKMRIAMNVHMADLISLDNSLVSFQRSLVEIMQIGFSFAIGLLIWFVLAFRKSNWRLLLDRLNGDSESKNTLA